MRAHTHAHPHTNTHTHIRIPIQTCTHTLTPIFCKIQLVSHTQSTMTISERNGYAVRLVLFMAMSALWKSEMNGKTMLAGTLCISSLYLLFWVFKVFKMHQYCSANHSHLPHSSFLALEKKNVKKLAQSSLTWPQSADGSMSESSGLLSFFCFLCFLAATEEPCCAASAQPVLPDCPNKHKTDYPRNDAH